MPASREREAVWIKSIGQTLIWGGVFLWLAWIIKPAGQGWVPSRLGVDTLIAAALIVAGVLLGLAAVFAFALQGRGTPFPLDPPRALVALGPYQYVRNPLYWAAGFIVAGELSLYNRSLDPGWEGFAIVPVALLVVHLLVVRIEEPDLRKRFGEDYERYCRRVPRWLPRFGRT